MNAAGALPIAEAVAIAKQVAADIDAAYRGGAAHRHLKPSHIVLRQDQGGRLQAKVVDSGSAMLKERRAAGALTGDPPRYMSPEQCRGREADERSDIYSLAVILYEMIAGRAPFDASTATAITVKQMLQQPPPLKEFRAGVPGDLENLVRQALDKEPSARPQSAAAFAHRLGELKIDASASQPAFQTQRPAAPAGERIPAILENQEALPVKASTLASASVPFLAAKSNEAAVKASDKSVAAIKPETDKTVDESKRPVIAGQAISQPKGQWWTTLMLACLALISFFLAYKVSTLWLSPKPESASTTGATETTPAPQNDSGATVADNASAPPANPVATSPPRIAGAVNTPRDGDQNTAADKNAATDEVAARAELRSLLEQWLASANTSDVNKQMSFYADKMDAYYLKRNVSRAFVQREKTSRAGRVDSIRLGAGEPQISINKDGRHATMAFRKLYRNKNARGSIGEVLTELRWLKTSAGWKIVYERDLKRLR